MEAVQGSVKRSGNRMDEVRARVKERPTRQLPLLASSPHAKETTALFVWRINARHSDQTDTCRGALSLLPAVPRPKESPAIKHNERNHNWDSQTYTNKTDLGVMRLFRHLFLALKNGQIQNTMREKKTELINMHRITSHHNLSTTRKQSDKGVQYKDEE